MLKWYSSPRRSLSNSFLNPQLTYMIFIYSLLFIHHFTGLLVTNIITSSQLACYLSWYSTALVSQKSWVQIRYKPVFFYEPRLNIQHPIHIRRIKILKTFFYPIFNRERKGEIKQINRNKYKGKTNQCLSESF